MMLLLLLSRRGRRSRLLLRPLVALVQPDETAACQQGTRCRVTHDGRSAGGSSVVK